MRPGILLLLFIIICLTIKAQNKRADSTYITLTWSAGASGFYMNGNTNKLYVMSTGEIKRQDSITTFDLLVSLDYGETNKLKDQNNIFGDFSADLFHYNTVSPLILQIGEFGFGRGIKFRSETGAGAKYNFIKHPEHKSSISMALIYDYTNLVDKPGNNDGRTWRLSWRFKTKQILFDNRIRLSNVTFFQPSVTAIANVIWRVESMLEAPIVKGFSLTVSHLYTHDDIVSIGRKKGDHKISFGLKIYGEE
jgi:hypothetical protein